MGHILLLQGSPACFGTVNLHLGHTHSLGLPLPFPLINSVNLFYYVDDVREVITVTRMHACADNHVQIGFIFGSFEGAGTLNLDLGT